jgi:hypothetical protein
MNTKQILFNALQSQLTIKEQEYNTFNETVTQPSYKQLEDEIKQFISTFANIDDWIFGVGSNKIYVKLDNSYSNEVGYHLHTNWDKSKSKWWVGVEWNSGEFNLHDKVSKMYYIDMVHTFAHNLHYVETKWINDWSDKFNNISENDYNIKNEWTNLKDALNKLSCEIKDDIANDMKKIGFEIKKFKKEHSFDWDYVNNARVYKIHVRNHSIRLQYGRSQYDGTHINGFKVLSKKGNKYKVEAHFDSERDNSPNRTYDVLEKKFESFINEVADWEYRQADKRKDEAEKRLADSTK